MAAAPMTVERAKLILKDTIAIFGAAENKARLVTAMEQCAAAPEEQRCIARFHRLCSSL